MMAHPAELSSILLSADHARLLEWEAVQSGETHLRFLTDNTDHYSLSVLAVYGINETVSGNITVPTLENATQWVDDMGQYYASFDIPNPDFPELNHNQIEPFVSDTVADQKM